jgi:hypothetical protein
MLTFLFWNLRGQNLGQSIARLVELYAVDILILAETNVSSTSPGALMTLLKGFYYSPDVDSPRVKIYNRFSSDFLPIAHSHDRYSIRVLALPDGSEMMIVAAHLISLMNRRESSLDEEAKMMARAIRQLEADRGHSRTLLVGDLNLNPFSRGVVSARGLHGVMTKQTARGGERTVRRTPYPFFYNPMWSRFGDQEGRAPGTYYYRGSDHVCYFWNIFDQVLIRPSLLERWDDTQLEIPATDGVESLLTGRQNTLGGKNKSDHLPLVFRLKL